jgi:hypothetical protein
VPDAHRARSETRAIAIAVANGPRWMPGASVANGLFRTGALANGDGDDALADDARRDAIMTWRAKRAATKRAAQNA